jgi:hypothetical protein
VGLLLRDLLVTKLTVVGKEKMVVLQRYLFVIVIKFTAVRTGKFVVV